MSKLKNQAVSGVMWTTVRTIITFLTGPLLLVVQARYLTPSEFGVLSVINIFLSIITVIENFGFSTAIIQREEVTTNERSSLFFFQTLFTTVIGILVVGTAPLVANIFDMDSLRFLLPLLSIVVILNGPAILFTAFLEKDFHFKELSLINIIRQVLLFIATSALLVIDLGLTAVVLGQIISVAVMVLLILLVSYRKGYMKLRFHFNFKELKPYITFGLSIGGKQLMTQLTHHVDEMIIGYFLSAEVLGLYFFAKNLLNRIRVLISTAFSKVLLPLLSKVKKDSAKLTRTYNDISRYVGVFAFPLFIGIALTADLFIPVLFGVEWLASVDFFIILSIAYIPYMLTANVATSLLYSVNKPNLVLYTDLVANTIYILLLLLFSWSELGIYSIVAVYSVYLIGKTTALQYLTQLFLESTFMDYIKLFKPAVFSSIIMSIAVLFTKTVIQNIESFVVALIIAIFVGVISYMISYIALDRKTLKEMVNLVRSR